MRLSDREKEVLALAAEGFTSKEIGKKLFVEETTIKRHRNRIIKKMKVRNITHAVAIAFQTGILPLDKPSLMVENKANG